MSAGAIAYFEILLEKQEGKFAREWLSEAIEALKAEPCEDAIDRRALRAQFNHLNEVYEGMSEEEEHDAYIYGQIIYAIDDAPSVTPKQRWIPVSERLPENRNLVLVTAYWHETHQVMVGSYWGNGVWWCAPWNNTSREHLKMLNAVAWMPLPEPYKEGESE